MKDATRHQLLTAVQCCNVVLNTLGDPAYALVERAAEILEDAYLRWPDTEKKIMRTWIRVAVDDLNAALRHLDSKGEPNA